jgi:hypothetical protein
MLLAPAVGLRLDKSVAWCHLLGLAIRNENIAHPDENIQKYAICYLHMSFVDLKTIMRS